VSDLFFATDSSKLVAVYNRRHEVSGWCVFVYKAWRANRIFCNFEVSSKCNDKYLHAPRHQAIASLNSHRRSSLTAFALYRRACPVTLLFVSMQQCLGSLRSIMRRCSISVFLAWQVCRCSGNLLITILNQHFDIESIRGRMPTSGAKYVV